MSEIAVTFDEMTVLSEGDVDIFVVNLNDVEGPAPYYVDVGERRFHFTGETFLIFGHSAILSAWVREQEAEGRLVLLGDRGDRYLRYLHDPAEELEDEGDEEGAGAVEAAAT